MLDGVSERNRRIIAQTIAANLSSQLALPDEGLTDPAIVNDAVLLLSEIQQNKSSDTVVKVIEDLKAVFRGLQSQNRNLSSRSPGKAGEDTVLSDTVGALIALELLPYSATTAIRSKLQQILVDSAENAVTSSSDENKERVRRLLEQVTSGDIGICLDRDKAAALVALSAALIAVASATDSAPIVEALKYLELAETIVEQHEDETIAVLLHLIRGRAFLRRHEGDRSDHLERAIFSLDYGLQRMNSDIFPVRQAKAQMELGTAYSERVEGNRTENLHKSIECYERALSIFDTNETPTLWAHTHINLGNVYQWLTSGDVTENQRLAASNYQAALTVLDPETATVAWTVVTMNLATLLIWQTDGGRSSNIERSIELYSSLFATLTGEGSEYDRAYINFNLGVAHVERLRGSRTRNLEAATKYMETALDVMTLDASPHQHGVWKLNLAATYQHLFTYDRGRYEDLETAIRLGNECLKIHELTADKRNCARLHNNLGVAYKDLASYGQSDHWDVAEKHLMIANNLMSEVEESIEFQQPLVELADLHLRNKQWEKATKVCYDAIRLIEKSSLHEAVLDGSQQQVFGRISEVSSIAAYCHLRSGNIAAALSVLEHGRARQMAVALGANVNADSLSPDQINGDWISENTPANGISVIILATIVGGAAVILHSLQGTICASSVCWLDDLDQNKIEELLYGTHGSDPASGWISGYRQAFGQDTAGTPLIRRWDETDRQTSDPAYKAWNDSVEFQAREIWRTVVGPIHEELIKMGLEENADVVLLPPGALSLVPLHAAIRCDKDDQAQRFGEFWSVSYAPSLKSLVASSARISELSGGSSNLLAVSDSHTGQSALPPLPGARQEVEALLGYFAPESTCTLSGGQVTRAAVLSALSDATYVHMSCHGMYNWEAPNQSGFALADGEWLNLADLIQNAELRKNRLFFASACETGFTDIERSPDEFMSIATGLMQAGTPNVIATLWPVFDDAAFLLSRRFYQLLFDRAGTAFDRPARALRQAQMWLRGVTFSELAKEFGTIVSEDRTMIKIEQRHRVAKFSNLQEASGPLEAAIEQDTLNTFLIPMGPDDERPYNQPHEWAGFIVYGP